MSNRVRQSVARYQETSNRIEKDKSDNKADTDKYPDILAVTIAYTTAKLGISKSSNPGSKEKRIQQVHAYYCNLKLINPNPQS